MRVAVVGLQRHWVVSLLVWSVHATASPSSPENAVPILRPGLWEITRTESLRPNHATLERRCVGSNKQELRAARQEYNQQFRRCTMSDVVVSKRARSFSAKCAKDEGVIVTSRVKYEGSFLSQFDKITTGSLSIPTPMEGMTIRESYKYAGVCPKEMALGDTTLATSAGRSLGNWNRYDSQSAKNGGDVEKSGSR